MLKWFIITKRLTVYILYPYLYILYCIQAEIKDDFQFLSNWKHKNIHQSQSTFCRTWLNNSRRMQTNVCLILIHSPFQHQDYNAETHFLRSVTNSRVCRILNFVQTQVPVRKESTPQRLKSM